MSVLLGQALSSADKRHLEALQSYLNMLEKSHLHCVFRSISYNYYCNNPAKFSESDTAGSTEHSTDGRAVEAGHQRLGASGGDLHCVSLPLLSVSANICLTVCMNDRNFLLQLDGLVTDDAIDAYLKEWSSVGNVRVQRNIPGGHPVSLR